MRTFRGFSELMMGVESNLMLGEQVVLEVVVAVHLHHLDFGSK